MYANVGTYITLFKKKNNFNIVSLAGRDCIVVAKYLLGIVVIIVSFLKKGTHSAVKKLAGSSVYSSSSSL